MTTVSARNISISLTEPVRINADGQLHAFQARDGQFLVIFGVKLVEIAEILTDRRRTAAPEGSQEACPRHVWRQVLGFLVHGRIGQDPETGNEHADNRPNGRSSR